MIESSKSTEDQPSRIVLAVDLDYFFAQCEEQRNPDLKKRPIVVCVYSGRTADSGAVSTSNYIARGLGVRSGIPIILAKRLLKDRGDSVFLPIDKEYYEMIAGRIMDSLRSNSDKFEQVSVDEAFLDITLRSSHEYAAAEKAARQIKKMILDSEGLTCSVGVAPNKLLAKMAADRNKPDGLTIIRPNEVAEFLRDMPVGKLIGVGPKTEKRMQSLGIHTISELARSSEEMLAKEFGKQLGPSLRMMANGLDNEPVMEKREEQLSRIITLKQDADSFSFDLELRQLTAGISSRLKESELKCKTIGIIAITTSLKTKSRTKTIEEPTYSASLLYDATSDLFKLFFEENKDVRVRRVGVKVSNLAQKEIQVSKSVSEASLTDFF